MRLLEIQQHFLRRFWIKPHYAIKVLCAVFSASLVAPASALAPDSDWFSPELTPAQDLIIEQRYHYELAKTALNASKMDVYQQHYAQMGDYPLGPYLDYTKIKQSLYEFDFSEIDRFLETNRDTFLAYRLREQLLYALATKKNWGQYLKYYAADMGQKPLRCHHLYAQIATGNKQLNNEVAQIWTGGKSHPKSCDRLFNVWRRAGGLTNDIAWQRFINAMSNNRRSLARYVAKLMNGDQNKYAKLFFKVDSHPALLKQHRIFEEQSKEIQQIIAHGIKRFARTAPRDALYHWELYEAQQLFEKETATDTKLYLVKKLSAKGYTKEAEALIKQSQDLQSIDVVERLIRDALRGENWDKVANWINTLDSKAQASDRWQYWRARAQTELALTDTTESSKTIYQRISKNRSFYGFLASDILKQSYSLEIKTASVQPSTMLLVENNLAMKRARELWLRGSYDEAQAEWQFATKSMDPQELMAAGKIARQWGWYHKSINAMISGNHWDELAIRFPLAYQDTVTKVSSDTKVEPTFIYAIARQESAFSEQARSSAGAMGLMQLMPATARQTARKSGIKHHDRYLYDPEYNINLGSHYLNELLQKFNGNRILAAAAYNAGPHRVNTWIKDISEDLPIDIWIETIPFKETRGYVQNVLSFSVIYANRMGRDEVFMTEQEANSPL